MKFNLDMEEESTLTVTIRNTDGNAHVLQNCAFVSQKTLSQLSVMSPTNMDISTVIKSSESISYIFKCKAKFVGRSKELYIFKFEDFEIGRLFHITVNAKNVSQNALTTSVAQRRSQKINFVNLNEENEMTYIPGIKPYRPPAFVKARNGIFHVPRYIWNIILDNMKDGKSQMECEIALENEISCLLKQLTLNMYKERFHVLLYLEEIAQTLNIQQYDIKNAVLRRCEEYLTLEVPGLVEKRPSLLIGDRAVVSFHGDNSQGNIYPKNKKT